MKEQFYSSFSFSSSSCCCCCCYVLIVAVALVAVVLPVALVVIELECKDKDEGAKNKKDLKEDELIVGEAICVLSSSSLFVKMNRAN